MPITGSPQQNIYPQRLCVILDLTSLDVNLQPRWKTLIVRTIVAVLMTCYRCCHLSSMMHGSQTLKNQEQGCFSKSPSCKITLEIFNPSQQAPGRRDNVAAHLIIQFSCQTADTDCRLHDQSLPAYFFIKQVVFPQDHCKQSLPPQAMHLPKICQVIALHKMQTQSFRSSPGKQEKRIRCEVPHGVSFSFRVPVSRMLDKQAGSEP